MHRDVQLLHIPNKWKQNKLILCHWNFPQSQNIHKQMKADRFQKYDIYCYAYGDFWEEYGKELGVIVHEYITVTYPKGFSCQYTGMGAQKRKWSFNYRDIF